jgi:hypothetical protein
VHLVAGTWRTELTGGTAGWRGLWGSGPGDIRVVGTGGETLHNIGDGWWRGSLPTSTDLLAIGGSGPSDVWVVGALGTPWHFDGVDWSPYATESRQPLYAIDGRDAGSVWAVGAGGAALALTTPMPTAYGGECAAPVPISCGGGAAGAIAVDAPNRFDAHACAERATPGGEAYFRIEVPMPGRLEAPVRSQGDRVELVAIAADDRGGCDPWPESCRGSGVREGGGDRLVLDVVQGQTLYLVVDAVDASAPGFELSVSCEKEQLD